MQLRVNVRDRVRVRFSSPERLPSSDCIDHLLPVTIGALSER
jgi:hypothetical protein